MEVYDSTLGTEALEAWHGLSQDRSPEVAGYDGHGPSVHTDPERLGVLLNQAIAGWTGRSYAPFPDSTEASIYRRMVTEDAAIRGDIEAMRAALRGRICLPSKYGGALEIAAIRGDVEFVRALIEELGMSVASGLFDACEQLANPTAHDRTMIATALDAGIPCPAQFRKVLRLWGKTDHRFVAQTL